jgi:hypothetical protein
MGEGDMGSAAINLITEELGRSILAGIWMRQLVEK